AVKNNDSMGIIKRLQTATKKYDNNTDLKDYDDDNLFAHNELLDESIETQSVLKEEKGSNSMKQQREHLHYIPFGTKKNLLKKLMRTVEEVNENNDIGELLEDKIKSII
ncbi:19054_t:CDS:2, partial [Gigaspora margarita]